MLRAIVFLCLCTPSFLFAKEQAKWKDFHLFGGPHVVEMHITLKYDGGLSWERGPLGIPGARKYKGDSFKVTNADVLSYVEGAISQVHKVAADPKGGFVGPFVKMGTIKLVTKKKTIEIGVSNAGFTLGNEWPSQDNLFFCWGLAKIVDDQYRK